MEILVYLVLGITSVIGLAFIVERAVMLRWAKVVPPVIVDALAACKSRDDVKGLRARVRPRTVALGPAAVAGRRSFGLAEGRQYVEALQTAARHEIVRLERGLVVLEIIVGIAPLLGLVGTIAGMITVFGDLGQTGPERRYKTGPGDCADFVGDAYRIADCHSLADCLELLQQESRGFCGGNGGALRRFHPSAISSEMRDLNPIKAKAAGGSRCQISGARPKKIMRFLIHKRRNTPTVIIVALVDVLIVLLIFLMVTTTFKQQSALKLTLPESSQAKKSGANKTRRLW